MSANPDFFDFMRKALGARLGDLARTGAHVDELSIASLAEKISSEAFEAGLCVELSEGDRASVVSRVCAFYAKNPLAGRRREPTTSNAALWAYLRPRSLRLALASARANGGAPDPAVLAVKLWALVNAYRAQPGRAALDDDAQGIVARLVAYRSKWRPRSSALRPPLVPKPGATAAARRALDRAVTDLVDNTSGPDPALYKGLHTDRPSLTLSVGKNGKLKRRISQTHRPSVGAIHRIVSERATGQKRLQPSRSAVAGAIRKAYGAPNRNARLSALPPPARKVYDILAASLPSKRISTVKALKLAEQIWGEAACASTKRGHRKRLREALDKLTDTKIDLNAAMIGEIVVVGRGRKLPIDLEEAAESIEPRTIDAGRVAFSSGIWSTPEGEAAKSYLRLLAGRGGVDDVERLERFQENEVTGFARVISRANPTLLETPAQFLEEVARGARQVLHQPTIEQLERGLEPTTGWPEAAAAAQDVLDVVEAVLESDSLIVGWRKLSAAPKADSRVTSALGSIIAEIKDPDALDAFLALSDREADEASPSLPVRRPRSSPSADPQPMKRVKHRKPT